MVAASSAVDRLTEACTPPVPGTRSENISGVSVRLSPFATLSCTVMVATLRFSVTGSSPSSLGSYLSSNTVLSMS